MASYWKSKLLPKIKKVFENPKKTAAAEASKVFDESKEQYSKEFEDKKTELQPKVVEIYEACSTEIKALVKEPNDLALKKHSTAVQKFLDELSMIEFPGSKPVCEAASKIGVGYLPGPVFFVLEKVSTFIVVTEEKKEEVVPEAANPELVTSTSTTAGLDAVEDIKEKEITNVEDEEKKKELEEACLVTTSPGKDTETTTDKVPASKVEKDAPPVPAADPPKP